MRWFVKKELIHKKKKLLLQCVPNFKFDCYLIVWEVFELNLTSGINMEIKQKMYKCLLSIRHNA
jgi:hypothetical protein